MAVVRSLTSDGTTTYPFVPTLMEFVPTSNGWAQWEKARKKAGSSLSRMVRLTTQLCARQVLINVTGPDPMGLAPGFGGT